IITTYGPLNSYSISQYYFLTNGYDENYEVNDESFSYMQVFDNENIMNYLIPATLVAADSFRQILSPGHTLIDIDIKLDFGYYANFIYTFAFGGLKILGYKSSHLISWIELESADIGSIKFLN
ncbi:MAG: hypothetical protein KA273_03310, partial [Bacteroidales bacterium]|nr:hypothetical protein [Bacteroidales bacterium]